MTPAYNKGDHKGCYERYRAAGEKILENCSLKGVRQELRSAVELADKQPSFTKQAWTMRHAFDAILEDNNYAVSHTRVKNSLKLLLVFTSFINVCLLQVIIEFLAGLQWSSNSVSLRVEGEGEGLVTSLRHNLTLLLHPQ